VPSDVDVAIQLPDAPSQITSASSLTWYDLLNSDVEPVAFAMRDITPKELKDEMIGALTQPNLTGEWRPMRS
jgi:hypothetical protein